MTFFVLVCPLLGLFGPRIKICVVSDRSCSGHPPWFQSTGHRYDQSTWPECRCWSAFPDRWDHCGILADVTRGCIDQIQPIGSANPRKCPASPRRWSGSGCYGTVFCASPGSFQASKTSLSRSKRASPSSVPIQISPAWLMKTTPCFVMGSGRFPCQILSGSGRTVPYPDPAG